MLWLEYSNLVRFRTPINLNYLQLLGAHIVPQNPHFQKFSTGSAPLTATCFAIACKSIPTLSWYSEKGNIPATAIK